MRFPAGERVGAVSSQGGPHGGAPDFPAAITAEIRPGALPGLQFRYNPPHLTRGEGGGGDVSEYKVPVVRG